jgi:hypothetical protein
MMSGFKKEAFQKVVYFSHDGSGAGGSPDDALAIVDGSVMDIDAGMVIEEVLLVVTEAVTGATQLDLGDGTDPDGFVAAATLTLDAVTRSNGAYLDNSGAGLAKYYAAADTLDLDVTGSSTAGKFAVVVSGYKI